MVKNCVYMYLSFMRNSYLKTGKTIEKLSFVPATKPLEYLLTPISIEESFRMPNLLKLMRVQNEKLN